MTERMNPEIKKLWVDALRSGEYEQARGTLCIVYGEKSSYCCLGVLCELAFKEGVVKHVAYREWQGVENNYVQEKTYDGSAGALPYNVRVWAGSIQPSPCIFSRYTTVAELNDSGDYTFSEIANLIEKEL